MNIESIINCISLNNHFGIKAATQRETFLEIWMVTVDNRIFARSWGFSEKSWYNTFLKERKGQIKCGEMVLNVEAKIPEDLLFITEQINNAYLQKYNSGKNSFFAQGIIQKEHAEKTLEFVILEND